MPPVYRFIEIIVYSLLNFLPFLALALYPFRHSLRFSRGVTGILIGLLSVIQVMLGAWVSFVPGNHAAIASALSTALYAAFYFLAVKKHFGKTLFTLLMISNLANFAVISAKCIEGLLFPVGYAELPMVVFADALCRGDHSLCADLSLYEVCIHSGSGKRTVRL